MPYRMDRLKLGCFPLSTWKRLGIVIPIMCCNNTASILQRFTSYVVSLPTIVQFLSMFAHWCVSTCNKKSTSMAVSHIVLPMQS